MSDTDPKDPQDKPDPKPDTGEKNYEAEAEKWKALARKHEKEAKALAEKAKRLDEIEDATKTEVEKAADRAAKAEKRAEEAELKALRIEVAAEKGLTPAQAKRLVGTSREELESDADELLETFKPSGDDKGSPPGGKPKEDLKGGTDPTEEPEEMDPRKLADMVPRG